MADNAIIRCFLSHPWAGHIHHFALRLTSSLRQRKFIIWIDEEQMLPGQTIELRQINGIVYETDIFIFVLAPETLRSANCMEELHVALANGKPIICVNLETCAVPIELRKSLLVDFSSPAFYEASVNKLVEGAGKLGERYKIIQLLSDDNPEFRSEAARILGDLHDPTNIRLILAKASLERDDSVIYWLLVSLGTLFEGETEDGVQVLELLDHFDKTGSPLVRQGVFDAKKKINEGIDGTS